MITLCITAEWWDALADTGTALATIILVIVAYNQLNNLRGQLRNLNSSNRINTLMAVLDHEAEITRRKIEMDNATFDWEEYIDQHTAPDTKSDILRRKMNIAIENYLNSIDRLAFCIRNNYFPEKDWKAEYKQVFKQIADTFPDKFGIDSQYINFIDLYETWRRE